MELARGTGKQDLWISSTAPDVFDAQQLIHEGSIHRTGGIDVDERIVRIPGGERDTDQALFRLGRYRRDGEEELWLRRRIDDHDPARGLLAGPDPALRVEGEGDRLLEPLYDLLRHDGASGLLVGGGGRFLRGSP